MQYIYVTVIAIQILVILVCMYAIHVSMNMSGSQGQKYMTTFLLAVIVQNIGNLFEITQYTAEGALVAIRMQYLGSCFSLLFFSMFVFYYFKADSPKLLFRILAFFNVGILILMWTCNYHKFFYTNMEFVADVSHPHYVLTHGFGYILFVLICCGIPWSLSVGVVIYQRIFNPHVLVGKYWKLFILATMIPFCYLIFVSFVPVSYDLSPIILGLLLSVTVIFILSRNVYDLNELTLQTMLREIDEGIIILNPLGNMVQCNLAAERMFDLRKTDSLPQELQSHVDLMSIPNYSSFKIEYNEHSYECHLRAIRDRKGSPLSYFILILDMTETENYIDQLKILKEKADAANYSKSQFLSNMSHEIRTPMNSIIGITEILLREKWKSKDKEYLMNIKNSGNALISIINDILDFSKIEAGNMEFVERNYEPISMLSDLALMFLNRIGNKEVELIFDIDEKLPALLYGDEVRVRQVLINLINNAIKFTDKGFVKLVLTSEILDKKVVLHCEVWDSGTGIKKENISELFKAFKRVGLEDHYTKEGTGLGLSITKALVEHMGGTISVSSIYGQGSCFSFDIAQGFVTEHAAIQISNEIVSGKLFCTLLDNSYVKENCDKLLKKFGIEQVDFNKAKENNLIIDYMILDDDNFIKLSDEIGIIKNMGTKVYLLQNPMLEQVADPGLEILNKPLYSNSLNHILVNRHKAETQIKEHVNKRFEAPSAKILLVDDNEMNRKVAKELLKPIKLQIDEAVNGLEAIEALKTQDYCMVLMDHMMPVMDGVEATREIRKKNNPYYENLPIIALTANAIVGVKDEIMGAGMNDYVSKPINVDELYKVVYKYLPKQLINEANDFEHEGQAELQDELDLGSEINREEAINNCGSESFFLEMLNDFYKLIEVKARKCESLLAEEMIRDYTIEVHALKNSARLIGASSLSDEFLHLEKLGNEEKLDGIQVLSPIVMDHFRSFKEILKPIAEKANQEKKVIPKEELLSLLDNLYQQVDSFDYDSADETLKELSLVHFSDEVMNDFELLQAYMADVDMDHILETISSIKENLD